MQLQNTLSRGRPRTFDKGQALEKALTLFWQNGYEGTSINDLTAALGIAAPSIYAAFGSKDALYREAVDLYLSTRSERLVRALGKAGPARAAVEAMLREAADAFAAADGPRGCLVATGVLHPAKENRRIGDLTASLRRQMREAIERRLHDAKSNGEFARRVDLAALASYYAAVIQGMSVQAIDGASRVCLRNVAKFAMAAWPSPQATKQPT